MICLYGQDCDANQHSAVSQVVHELAQDVEQHVRRNQGCGRTVNRIEYQHLALRKHIMATRGVYAMVDLLMLAKSDLSWRDARHFVTEHVVERLAGPSSECLWANHALLDFLSQWHAHQFPRLLDTTGMAILAEEAATEAEAASPGFGFGESPGPSARADDE